MARLPAAVSTGLLLLTACVRAVPPSEPGGNPDPTAERVLERIADWEDRRSLGGGELVRLATVSPDATVRRRALRALGRIQDVTTLDAVQAGLAASDASVRDEAAFAVGELALSWEPLPDEARTALTGALARAEASEADPAVRTTLLESLGKLATPGAVEVLTARLSPPDSPWAAPAAKALGVAARKAGAASVAAVPLAAMVALTEPARPQAVRYGGAYLLATAKRPEAVAALRGCTGDSDPDVRALCAKGLGDVGGPTDAPALAPLLADGTPRVAAEAARALAKHVAKCQPAEGPTGCAPLGALAALGPRVTQVAAGNAAWAHPLLAVAQQGLPVSGRPLLINLRRSMAEADRGATSDEARADLAWLDCRFAATLDRQSGEPREVHACGFGRVSVPRRLALGLREVAQFTQGASAPSTPGGATPRGPGAAFAVPLLGHASPLVRGAALEVVAERPVPEALAPVRALIAGDDAVVAGLAASAAGKLHDAEALPAVEALAARVPREPDLAEAVAGALVALQGRAAEPRLREWLGHPYANVRRVAAEALTSLTGAPVRSARVELPAGTYRPPAAPPGTTLTLRTRKGDITVLLERDAPLTGGNLVALAKQGYFRGVTFHRVVPDFVAQGGDPRGDGEGGPGHSIRCEMTRRPYTRGVVGMALSGKDTGGSQFFFTHSPQPHLDGRYTVFGAVIAGMDTVDALLEGTVIDDVVVGTHAP
ncbi:peptidylprolyl isomerase [Corallococcus llansteffanensis]|uniref:peptidylprolyl isomerase n=1 Tax=Corallococcus llansteffanensis TaxID=2316731 RepID=A0A3A8PC15_9BACT|nr:peptidylprolyl isomerase [Corallococcus llansteffanensis]RKH52850.1 peptidyl-prolyl cis-trans isomerase [Corallococcus llansteffanensis]